MLINATVQIRMIQFMFESFGAFIFGTSRLSDEFST